jgi:DNA invertase Pin-like site-specific DNA recombinase
MSAAIYCRISRDRMGAGLGVGRQQADCEAYADQHGLTIVDTFTDNDLSAYSGKPRPGYDALVAAIEAGTVDTVLAWHVDRLTRQPAELEHLMAVVGRAGATVRTVTAGELDPTSPDGMLLARMAGSIAAYESAHKSRRITRKVQQMAEQGKPAGGRRRFGYEVGMQTIRESEAVVVRDLISRLLGGESLHSLAKWCAEQGVTGTSGATITGPNMRHLLRSPHLAGLRVHHGEVIGAGNWPAIIDRGTHEAVCALLDKPERRTNNTGNARKYLLTGMARCGTCGLALRGRPTYKGDGRAYACPTGAHVARAMDAVDLYVVEAIVARLEALDEAGAFLEDSASDEVAHLTMQRDALAERLAEAGAEFAAGRMTMAVLNSVTAGVETEQARVAELLAEAQVADKRPQAVLAGMTGRGAGDAFRAAPLGRQRAVVDALATVTVNASAPGRKERFDPERHVTLTWR